jgi:hypothetical protein
VGTRSAGLQLAQWARSSWSTNSVLCLCLFLPYILSRFTSTTRSPSCAECIGSVLPWTASVKVTEKSSSFKPTRMDNQIAKGTVNALLSSLGSDLIVSASLGVNHTSCPARLPSHPEHTHSPCPMAFMVAAEGMLRIAQAGGTLEVGHHYVFAVTHSPMIESAPCAQQCVCNSAPISINGFALSPSSCCDIR